MLLGLFHSFAAACNLNYFLGIPPWYKYMVDAGRMKAYTLPNGAQGPCEVVNEFQWKDGGDVTLIALGILDIVLRIAGIIAVGYIIYGGVLYIASEGQPDKTKEAQQTIINALIGLVIALIAVAATSFIGRAITK